jgi:hypothetical protein
MSKFNSELNPSHVGMEDREKTLLLQNDFAHLKSKILASANECIIASFVYY